MSWLGLHSLECSELHGDEIAGLESLMDFRGSLLTHDPNQAECAFDIDLRMVAPEERFGFTLRATIRARYDSEVALDEDQWRSFATVQNVFLTWPYVRELISGITSRMSVPAFLLPLLQIPDRIGESNEGEARD